MTGRQRRWDLLVVGGGTAGIVGATLAARLGARVALVEAARTGGDCLWTGCVPSKALLAAASAAATARRAGALGVQVPQVQVDFPAVMAHVQRAIDTIAPVDSPEALQRAGVHVVGGHAVFTAPDAVDVDGRHLAFSRALLATGSAPLVPDLPGLAVARPLTTETVWRLPELPDRLVVVGGGSTGCELGQGFARLGSAVTIVQRAPRLLPEEDPDASALVRRALERDGVRVLTGTRAIAVGGTSGGGGDVRVDDGNGQADVGFDVLLLAVGRRPRTDGLGLDQAGVRVAPDGEVEVDDTLRTSNPRVFAAGDVTGPPLYTHVAGTHAGAAAANAVLGLRRRVERRGAPRVTFTDPEVAAVGAPTWPACGDDTTRVVTQRLDGVDRAVTDDRDDGFTRLALDRRGRVLGATLVGPRAGECLAEVVLAVRQHVSTGALTATAHAYPSYADGTWNAAIDDAMARLGSPAARRVLWVLVRARAASLATRSALGGLTRGQGGDRSGR